MSARRLWKREREQGTGNREASRDISTVDYVKCRIRRSYLACINALTPGEKMDGCEEPMDAMDAMDAPPFGCDRSPLLVLLAVLVLRGWRIKNIRA
jgi:hypothetical protein